MAVFYPPPSHLPSSPVISKVNQEDLLELLGKAVTCAVLGKAGPQRSRVLGLLYKVTKYLSLGECLIELSVCEERMEVLTLSSIPDYSFFIFHMCAKQFQSLFTF